MKRLFSLFSSRGCLVLVAVVGAASSISAAIAGFAGYGFIGQAAMVSSIVASIFLLLALVSRRAEPEAAGTEDVALNVVRTISAVCEKVCKGDFEARIIGIKEDGALAEAQHQVNDLIDRCDAFVREATASMEAVCRNVYSRRILYGGLQGAFRVAAETINGSVRAQQEAVEKARIDAAAAQQMIIDSLGAGLRNLAEGDLSARLDGFPESYRQVEDDFNGAVDQLRETIQAIVAATREVTNAASEISTSTTDLSQRTEEQAASLEETSASMEEISSTVKKNAENALQANQSASSAREVADRGGQVAAKAVAAMTRIEESSRKISDIIGVIDEIARQTNLLALNAAVEAARAGEAGRGFAVVASEVRSLAQRSSQAAKDIKGLITSSNGQVQEGVNLVNEAGQALGGIVESIKTVAAIVSDIASASAEQATGIEEVNKALNQMDEVTQQNSALVEENAATAKTLEQQAQSMDDRVSFFRIDEVGAAPGRRSAAAVPVAVGGKAGARPPQSAKAAGASRAPVRRMQGALAIKKDAEWQEF
ncbi:MAG: hypothetical protein IT537_27410 [Hyphomicrobiales bacterium]|nr:hypothetical protein [Hyphomicrobiales bacterium]